MLLDIFVFVENGNKMDKCISLPEYNSLAIQFLLFVDTSHIEYLIYLFLFLHLFVDQRRKFRNVQSMWTWKTFIAK